MMPCIIAGICDAIQELCTTRAGNSGIRKAKERLQKFASASSKSDGSPLYSDTVQAAAKNANTMQTDVSFRHLEKAVLAPAVAVGPTVAAVAELDRVPGLQIDADATGAIGGAGGASAGGGVSSMSLFQEDATVSRIFGAVLLPTHGFSGDCLAAALRSPHSL